jgi:CheY-like chemotaxis protein
MVEPSQTVGIAGGADTERLRQSLATVTDQFEAATDVLSALGRSAGEPDTALTTIVESVGRLCRSQADHLYLLEDGVYRLIKTVGMTEESIAYIAEHPIPVDRERLIHSGYEVIEALTVEDGIRLADEADPDLILMDLQLPGIDGTEALRQIRLSTRGREIPALAVTAFAMEDDRARRVHAHSIRGIDTSRAVS